MENRFTNEELNILKRGAIEEVEKDFRLHKAMSQETLHLLFEYLKIINSPEEYSELDKEVNYYALLSCYRFWKVYFTESSEIAIQKWEEEQEKIRKENEELHKDIMKRLTEIVDELISEK